MGRKSGVQDEVRGKRAWWRRKRVLIPAGLLAFIVLVQAMSGGADTAPTSTSSASSAAVAEAPAQAAPEQEKPAAPAVPAEHKAALAKAQSYADNMNMSKAAVRDQLTSEYGEKFPKAAADYAIANVTADWNKNALEKAKSYRDDMNMSTAAIREQLVSKHGEKFTKAEADWAVANLDK